MHETAQSRRTQPGRSEPSIAWAQYHSVELSMADLAMPYQFKIWCTESTPLCFIVREDSDIIKRLRVGETVPMKYYSPDAACPWTYHPTKIRNIKRSEQGPFKGHYLVSLEIKAEPDPVVG